MEYAIESGKSVGEAPQYLTRKDFCSTEKNEWNTAVLSLTLWNVSYVMSTLLFKHV